VNIRTYQPGDEVVQAEIYNQAAGSLNKFKPATAEEVGRRCRAADFDPATRFYAEADGKVVGYASYHANGRVSYPWCRPGFEHAAAPLFGRVLEAMRGRGMRGAFAAYRSDWTTVTEFFSERAFRKAREMVNFVLDAVDMPTRPGARKHPITPLTRADIPAVHAMGREVLRTGSEGELEQYLLQNPCFSEDVAFVLRNRSDESPLAVGLLVAKPAYADPHQLDASMPCFRLGAFGTEGMQTKRVNGLFSFLCRVPRSATPAALDLMGYAAEHLDEAGIGALAAQVPSDALELLHFYEHYFHRQGAFPVYEFRL
jgi:hypothetical protein